MPQAIIEQSSLYFSEGSSDKEYHTQLIEKSPGDYVVNFQYGRRGASLTAGTKTKEPVSLDLAKKAYDKLVKEKTSKGYTPDVSGTSYTGTENAGIKTDFVPQLLNSIAEDEAMRLIEDDEWCMQEKMDGERRAVNADWVIENPIGINRKGLAVALPKTVSDEMMDFSIGGEARVDAEIIGDTLHVFDLHVRRGISMRQSGFLERMRIAEDLLSSSPYRYIKAVPVAVTTEEKRALFNKVKAARGEGVVFKRINARVTEGRPNSGGDWLKFKFTESASCIVKSIHPTKRSVGISLVDSDDIENQNDHAAARSKFPSLKAVHCVIDVGNVTVLPNFEIPQVGDIIEVEYLYARKGGSLYQPVYRGKRTDIDTDACTTSQLKYKPENYKDEDEQ